MISGATVPGAFLADLLPWSEYPRYAVRYTRGLCH